MAILWMDNFDQYGSDEDSAEAGMWAMIDSVGGQWTLSSAVSRSGTYALFKGDSISAAMARRIVGKTVTTIGLSFGLYIDLMPRANDECVIVDFRDSDGRTNVGLVLQTTGILSVIRGHIDAPATELASTSVPAVRAHSFQHVEMKVHFDGSVGTVEVRVNGTTVIDATGLNTVAGLSDKGNNESASAAECAEIDFWAGLNKDNSNADTFYHGNLRIDDVVVWDTSGSANNDFLGDVIVRTLSPTADTAQADWTALSGSAYENIDDMPGKDDDTSYVSAGVPGSPSEISSEFDIENLNSTSGSVLAVSTVSAIRKDEAGLADIQNGIVSGGVEARGATHTIGQSYSYYWDTFETDPNTGVAFTPTDINNLKIQINRVT